MCDCLDEENDEGKPLTWTYVGQGRGDWAEAKNLEFVGHGKGAFIQDRENKGYICCRTNVLACLCCGALLMLVPLLIWLFYSGTWRLPDVGHYDVVQPPAWSCNSPPLTGAAAAGAAIMEEAWMSLDVDMDGYIPKASLPLWQSQNLMSHSAALYLNSTKAEEGMISNDAYIETLLKSDSNALADEEWVSGAWLLCDKNQDARVTKIEMGFLQRHGTLREGIDEQLWGADADGDGALDRDEFAKGLATVALHSQGAIQQLFHEVQTRYWPIAKRTFCCQTQGVCGLNLPTGGMQTTESTSFAGSYDCTTGADHVEGWTEMHRAWCCSRQSVGCFSAISVPYDCNAGVERWEKGWSSKKQEWCCFHLGKGCAKEEGDHLDYDHHDHHVVGVGKPVLVGEQVHVYDVVHKTSHEFAPFNCGEGFENWQVGWSTDKKTWCCDHVHRGCEAAEAYDDTHVVHHVVHHVVPAPAPAPATETVVSDGEAETAHYDCSAGFSNWRNGWSLEKKSWCCEKEQRGCV